MRLNRNILTLLKKVALIPIVRWAVVNATFILPLWCLVFGNLYSLATFEVSSESPYTIAFQDSTIAGTGRETRTYIAPGMNPMEMRYVLTNDKKDGYIRTISCYRYLIFKLTSKKVITDGKSWHSDGWTISMPINKYSLSFLLLELMALTFIAFVRLQPTGGMLRIIFRDSMLTATLVTVLFAIILPAQSYLVNRYSFDFTLSSFAVASAIRAIMIWIGVFASLVFLNTIVGRFVTPIAIGACTYVYLATGILAIGYPQLTGAVEFFEDNSRSCIDLAVLFTCLTVPLFLWRWVRRHMVLIVLILSFLCALSLFDVREQQKTNTESKLEGSYLPYEQIAHSARFSKEKNVIVFVMDSISTEHFVSAIKRQPSLSQSFSGFVAYTNNVGMYAYTPLGFAGIMTGNPVLSADDGIRYAFSAFTAASALADYLARGAEVYVCPGSFRNGFSNRKDLKQTDVFTSGYGIFDLPIVDLSNWSLNEIVTFRVLPFISKAWYIAQMGIGTGLWHSPWMEQVVYAGLEAAKVSQDSMLTLCVFHTEGAHAPFSTDEYGHILTAPKNDFQSEDDKTICALRSLGRLLNTMEQLGVRKNAIIIACADHGGLYSRLTNVYGTNTSARPYPFLMVKGAEDDKPFRFSPFSTWHGNIASLIRCAITNDCKAGTVTKVLHADNRKYEELIDGKIKVWTFATNGVCTISERLPETELFPIELNRQYDLRRDQLPIRFVGCGRHGDNTAYFSGENKSAQLMYKVKDAMRKYNMTLTISASMECEGNTTLFINGQMAGTISSGHVSKLSVANVAPDSNGILKCNLSIQDSKCVASILGIKIE